MNLVPTLPPAGQTDEWDQTWKHPTQMQLDALRHVMKCNGHSKVQIERGLAADHSMNVRLNGIGKIAAVEADRNYQLDEYDQAEAMLLAKHSLWYSQACGWASRNFSFDKPVEALAIGGAAIKAVVDWGYQDGEWWNPAKIWPDPLARGINLAMIYEVMRITRILRQRTLYLTSTWFEHLPMLIVPGYSQTRATDLLGSVNGSAVLVSELRALYDPEWRKQHNATVKQARAKLHEDYVPAKCIMPECENLVAPKSIEPRDGHCRNYRGLGSCCREHANYPCDKCEAIHSYSTKVGKAHLKWRGLDAAKYKKG